MPKHTVLADGEAMPPATAYLAVTPSMRKRLAATCEALIALLDEIDGDEHLEETGDDEPYLGWPNGGQRVTAEMASDDDREDDGDDLEPEPSGYGDEDGMIAEENGELDLGWTEHIDQTKSQLQHAVWVQDGECDLGFCGHGTGWREGETTDDREQDAGDECEMENEHFDEGYYDAPLPIPGGGSVSQHEDGWRADPNYVPPVKKKRGKQATANLQTPTVLFRRDEADSTPMPRYMWNDQWTGNLPPEANEVLIPEISMHKGPL